MQKSSIEQVRVLPPINLGKTHGPIRIVAFSDWRVQEIEWVHQFLKNLDPRPDLILYAGDDIGRFRYEEFPVQVEESGEVKLGPLEDVNWFARLAELTRFGLCGVIGNDEPPEIRKLLSGPKVYNVHRRPVCVGSFAMVGQEGAPLLPDDPHNPGYVLYREAVIQRHLVTANKSVPKKRLIIVSHCPPHGILDSAQRFGFRNIGSAVLRKFVETSSSVALVVCGHVHRCGGQSEKLGNATVINVASHDSPGSLGRIAVIDIQNNGQLNIRWHWLPGLQGIWDIGPGYKIALENKGITTVEELASADPEAVSKILNSGLPRARQLCARAKAGIQNTHIVLSEPKLPRGEWIFLDIETDPGQSWAWLIGVFSEHDHCFRQFFAKHPREEKGMLEDFVKYAQSQPNAIFLSKSGNNVDSRVPLARIKHYGLEEHFRSRIEDIHKALAESVVLPVRGFDLKTVASYFGYQFRHPDLDGRMVPFEYDEYVRSQNPAVAKRLLEYNEDDVMSLRYIVRKLMGTE